MLGETDVLRDVYTCHVTFRCRMTFSLLNFSLKNGFSGLLRLFCNLGSAISQTHRIREVHSLCTSRVGENSSVFQGLNRNCSQHGDQTV